MATATWHGGVARVALAIGLASGAAVHAQTTVDALIDSDLTTQFSGGADGFDAGQQATFIYIYDSSTHTTSAPDWTSPISVSSTSPPYGASGSAASGLDAAAYGYPVLVNVDRFGQFTLGAGQSMSASVTYSLSSIVNGPLPQASKTWVEMQVLGEQDGNYTELLQQTQKVQGVDPDFGTLSLTFTNTSLAPETYRFALNANAQLFATAVPEPTSWLLMVAGSAGLLLRRRR